MGKLIVTEFVTLDGVAQAPGGPDEDREGASPTAGGRRRWRTRSRARSSSSRRAAWTPSLLGRRTYEIFADYWPHAPPEVPFTGLLNGVPKYVASRTLSGPLAWQPSTLITGDLGEHVTALKGRHDEIHVIGSLDLVQSLLRLGLVDRMNLWVYPLLLGRGKRVFADGTVPTALHLTQSVTYPSGGLHLVYETAGVPTRNHGRR